MSIELALIALSRINIFSKIIVFIIKEVESYTNKIFIVDKYGNKKRVYKLKNFNVKIIGSNNIVEIHETASFAKIYGIIQGKNNKLIIRENCIFYENVYIGMCCSRNNRQIIIGKDVTIISAELHCWGNDSTIRINNDCMFSSNINICTSDGHPIFNKDTGKMAKTGRFVIIGEHCWIGAKANILKNVKLASNTIVGACSVVTKCVNEEYCAIAGNPAKIIKRNLTWSKEIS